MASQTCLRDTVFLESKLSQSPDNKYIVSGVFQRADKCNINGRIYRRSLWEGILNSPEIQDQLHNRTMLGELGHPEIIETTLTQVSHIVTDLRLEPNGDVIGEAEILDTPSGRVLKTLYEAGVRLGISSRGFVPEDVQFEESLEGDIVPDSYALVGFDFVLVPSTQGAYPARTESADRLDKALRENSDRLDTRLVESIKIISESFRSGEKRIPLRENKKIQKLTKVQTLEQKYKYKYNALKEAFEDLACYTTGLEKFTDSVREEYLSVSSKYNCLIGEYLDLENDFNLLSNDFRENKAKIAERFREVSSENTFLDDKLNKHISEKEDLEKELAKRENEVSDLKATNESLSRRYTLSRKAMLELRKRYNESSRLVPKRPLNSVAEARKNVHTSEEISSAIQAKAKEFRISVQECARLFKGVGNDFNALDFLLKEKISVLKNKYEELPLLADSSSKQTKSVISESSESRLSDLVFKAFKR